MPFFIIFIKILEVKNLAILIFIFSNYLAYSQQEKKAVDSLYREDQFYATITYNLFQHKPSGYNQYSISSGISFGFLRDMPINKLRTWAIAVGLGYSYDNLKHNIKVDNTTSEILYSFDDSFDKNKLVLHQLDLPIEIRWRNSTFESHKFWRVYTGFKVSYLFADKSVFKSSTENITVRKNNDLSKIRYSAYLSVGNNTGNIYLNYALTPLFKDVKINEENIKLSSFNVGFVFYIL